LKGFPEKLFDEYRVAISAEVTAKQKIFAVRCKSLKIFGLLFSHRHR
jgi:hypothetical protein